MLKVHKRVLRAFYWLLRVCHNIYVFMSQLQTQKYIYMRINQHSHIKKYIKSRRFQSLRIELYEMEAGFTH